MERENSVRMSNSYMTLYNAVWAALAAATALAVAAAGAGAHRQRVASERLLASPRHSPHALLERVERGRAGRGREGEGARPLPAARHAASATAAGRSVHGDLEAVAGAL